MIPTQQMRLLLAEDQTHATPVAAATASEIARRLAIVAVSLRMLARRVRAVAPMLASIDIAAAGHAERVEKVDALILRAARNISITAVYRDLIVSRMVGLTVSSGDRSTYMMEDTLGDVEPTMMAPEFWEGAYATIFAYMRDASLEALWTDPNLAPELRYVVGAHLLYLAIQQFYGGNDKFLNLHVRFLDPVQDAARRVAVAGETSAYFYAGGRSAPVFVTAGNIFGVLYAGELHASPRASALAPARGANDRDAFCDLVVRFLEIAHRDGRDGLSAPGDTARLLRDCAIMSAAEAARADEDAMREAIALYGVYSGERG